MINILNPDGTINENGGEYAGLDRYKAREAVVEDMEALGLFEGKEDRVIPLKYSDRSKTPIEPYLSDQWFVKMGDRDDGKPGLAQMAMDAVTSGQVKFFPERYAKTLPRLARREARLVHQPAALVGPPDPGVVRKSMRQKRAAMRRSPIVDDVDAAQRSMQDESASTGMVCDGDDTLHVCLSDDPELEKLSKRWASRKTPTSSTPGSAPRSGRTRRSAGRSRRRS